MRVRFWGTRGSIPVPGPETLRYGGNTPCVEVRADDGTLLIFDCGTGARKLGLTLARSGPVRAHLFIGHTHADHIQGLPFFLPAFLPGSHLTIYGPSGTNRSLRDAMRAQMEYDFFPIPFHDLPAQAQFRVLGEEELDIGGIRVQTQFLNHTAPCLGYRVESDGSTLVYSTDHEPHAPSLWRPDRSDGAFETDAMLHAGDARHAEFLRGADLVIHDSQYTASEYPFKIGWGHSPVEYVVDVALVARVKALALFHHDPGRTDDGLDRILEASRASVAASNIGMEVIAADEGTELTLTAGQAPSRPAIPAR